MGAIEWLPLSPGRSVRAEVVPAPARTREEIAAIDAAWDEMHRGNPALFDGPILSVLGFDAAAGLVRCALDSFRFFAAGPRVGPGAGAVSLGVKGVLRASKRGAERVLVGRRGEQTLEYGGMWELAPAGGVPAPGAHVGTLGIAELAGALSKESEEELGWALPSAEARAIALLRDDHARSVDVVFDVPVPGPIDLDAVRRDTRPRSKREYTAAAWLDRSQSFSLLGGERGPVAPPTAVILRALGWS